MTEQYIEEKKTVLKLQFQFWYLIHIIQTIAINKKYPRIFFFWKKETASDVAYVQTENSVLPYVRTIRSICESSSKVVFEI